MGIVTCILFAMWFASGLVMIYVPFPALTRGERLAGLPAIDWRQVRAQPADALRAAGVDRAETLALEMRGSRPVWRVSPWDGDEAVVSAVDARRLGEAGAAEARRIAALFGRAPVRAMTRIARDQWTVAGGFDRHRPLWKAELAGPAGRVLYVSSRTGAMVLDTAAAERFWNWLGSVPHWIYPTVLRRDNAVWRQVVMWVSGPCIAGAVTGMWIGILRTRIGRRRFKGGRVVPYHGWMLWHHVAGLVGGVFLLGWIFSGWLSVDPFRLFASRGVGQAARIAYAGQRGAPALDLPALARVAAGAKRVGLEWVAGRPLLAIERGDGRRAVLDVGTLAPARIGDDEIVRTAARLMPGTAIAGVDRLTAPDAYWYEVGGPPLLPVLRVRFADPAATWVHIDPADGQPLGDLDRRRRIYRWAFDLLHKWDLNVLTLRRPLWDGLLWLFSIIGLVTSVSGVWIGWKRLRRRKAVA